MALDVYAWLAQRLHRIESRRPQFITWAAIYAQFGQGFARLRDFRRAFLDVLDTVHAQYRAARVEADGHGITLRHSPPPVRGRMTIVPRPAVTVEHPGQTLTDQRQKTIRGEHVEPAARVSAEEVAAAQKEVAGLTELIDTLERHFRRGDAKWDELRQELYEERKQATENLEMLRRIMASQNTLANPARA